MNTSQKSQHISRQIKLFRKKTRTESMKLLSFFPIKKDLNNVADDEKTRFYQ